MVRPRPVAIEERHHAEHLEFDAGHVVPLCLRERLVQESADILVPAVPQVGARLRQQHGRPQSRHRGHWHATATAEQAMRGGIDSADIGRLLPENQFH